MSARRPSTGLNLPAATTNVGLPASEQQQIHNKWDTADRIEAELAMKGFVQMDLPAYPCPEVTEELLTTADNNEYSRVYAQQNAWFNYSSQLLARVTSSLLQAENEMEMIESRMRVEMRERIKGVKDEAGKALKMTAEQMQDEVNVNERYVELKLIAQEYKQRKITLSAFLDGIERSLRVISRQVEIRKMEAEQSRTNIPGRSPYPGQGGGSYGHQG